MAKISDDLVSVLRRRAKHLKQDGFDEQYLSALLRAADEIQARRMAAIPSSEEQLAVDAIADNRRLRNTLVHIVGQLRARKPAGWPDQVMAMAENTLAAVRPFGQGRRIMAVQVGDYDTREHVEAEVARLLDDHFHAKGAQQHGEDSEEEKPAGRDSAERPIEQPEDQRSEGEAAGDGSRGGERAGSAPGTAD